MSLWMKIGDHEWLRRDGARVWKSAHLLYCDPEDPKRLWEGVGPLPGDELARNHPGGQLRLFVTRRRFGTADSAKRAVDREFPIRSGWQCPVPLRVIPTDDSESFRGMPEGFTGLPLSPHPGAYGVERKNHFHEGVDLYCPEGTPVFAVEDGEVVKVEPFTGPSAGSEWWLDTMAVYVEGKSGVVVYGEIEPAEKVEAGRRVSAGDRIGRVIRVLRKDKGRPMSMLHIELHAAGARSAPEWTADSGKPETSLDPTPYLMATIDFPSGWVPQAERTPSAKRRKKAKAAVPDHASLSQQLPET